MKNKYVRLNLKANRIVRFKKFTYQHVKNTRYKSYKYGDEVIYNNRCILKDSILSKKEARYYYDEYNLIFKAKTSKGLRKKINEYLLLKEII